jgi:hypothetical protein
LIGVRTRLATVGGVPLIYLTLVLIAAVLAVIRLHQSSEMPGLAAIELVLIALPWSLALELEPLSPLGWSAMVGILLAGIVLNGLAVLTLSGWAQRHMRARATRGAANTD